MADVTHPLLVHDTRRVLYANAEACALFRRAALEFTTQAMPDLVVSEDFRQLMQILMRILRERGEAPDLEYPFLRGDLTVFWARVTSESLGDGRFSMTLAKTFEEWE